VRTQFNHTRAEWIIHHQCDDSATTGTRGFADSAVKKKFFTSSALDVPVVAGSLCRFSASWLVGGSDCSTCDGSGKSEPVTVAAPPGAPRRRYDPFEKAIAARLRDRARGLSAKHYPGCVSGPTVYAGSMCGLVAIYNGIAAYQDRIVNDPPDRRFRRRVRLSRPAPRRFSAAEVGAATGAVNALAATGSDVLAAGSALATAVDRAQGATVAKRPREERRQMLDAAGFARRLATALDRFAARSTTAAAALAATTPPAYTAPLGAPEWDAAREGLVFGAVAPALSAELRRLRLPTNAIGAAGGALTTVATVPEGDGRAAIADPALLASQRSAAAMLRRWAEAVTARPLAERG